MTFAKGAALKDPSGLFNSSLDGNTRRAIDFHEGEKIDEKALKTLVRAAVTLNKSKAQALIHGIKHFPGDPARKSHRLGSKIFAGTIQVKQAKLPGSAARDDRVLCDGEVERRGVGEVVVVAVAVVMTLRF